MTRNKGQQFSIAISLYHYSDPHYLRSPDHYRSSVKPCSTHNTLSLLSVHALPPSLSLPRVSSTGASAELR
ncbi:hypothetical protein E2C01_006675 [Portunus trituberculatus]|uniref:Uncharacterized protein n=1 Tax=Portunus trituberculatus TaxID=210409 RepID=A0A5B7D0B3_PORTR|nr:hypothetical protein [Portunus trituberculatus]